MEVSCLVDEVRKYCTLTKLLQKSLQDTRKTFHDINEARCVIDSECMAYVWNIKNNLSTGALVSRVLSGKCCSDGNAIYFWLVHDEEHNDIVTRSTATAQKA